MKFCESCGAKNATRAQFCSTCGTKFRITDVESARSSEDDVCERSKKRRARAFEVDAAGRVTDLAERTPKRDYPRDEKLNEATSRFGASLLAVVVSGWRLLARLLAPVWRWLLATLRDLIVRALSPASTWEPRHVPNFLYWGLVDFLAFQLPFAVVGIVYSVLANASRADGDYARGQERAELAKNWLLFDLGAGIVVLVFKNLVL